MGRISISTKKVIMMRFAQLYVPSIILAAGTLGSLASERPPLLEQAPQQQRLAAIQNLGSPEEQIERLEAARKSPSALIRRAAVRSLGKLDKIGIPLLKEYATTDADPLTRRTAIRLLSQKLDETARIELLQKGFSDDNDFVRASIIEEAAAIVPRSDAVHILLQEGQKDSSRLVSQAAAQALWPYLAEVASARQTPEFRDYQLDVIQRIDIAKTGWRFHTDPQQTGHLHHWMSTKIDESDWHTVAIERPWQDFGHQYNGVAWYRHQFTLPPRPHQDATDIVFQGVDESAWVWLNGEFLGAHDIGPNGYNTPFAVGTRDHLKWGEENSLVVRVQKTNGAHAGIWKPVYLELLKK